MKASIILSTYHSLCGLSQGMGLPPDQDIVQELYNLVGTEAIELLVSHDTLVGCRVLQYVVKKSNISK